MEKFSDVQKLKDLVDVASKVKNPRLSGVKIALNDIYEQELFDFGSKTGGPMWDKLRQILDRRKSPSPEEEISDQNPMIDLHDRDEVLNDPFMEDDDDNVPTRDDISEKRQTPLFNPRTVEWWQPHLNDTTQPATVTPADSPPSPPAAPGGSANPNPGGGMPGRERGSGGVSEAPTQVMSPTAPEKVGPVGSPEEGNAGEPETAEAVAMDDKILTLSASLQDYVNYLQENIKAFIKNREMIDKINGVVTMFNGINGTEIPLVEIPVVAPRKRNIDPKNQQTEIPGAFPAGQTNDIKK